jgi:DNA-directed RNA polymerase specialized sigma24 family protein
LLLITVSGLTQEETARQLNTATKAIEMRIRRAKKQLTQALSEFAREG